MQTLDLLKQKKREYGNTPERKVLFNKWIANNFFINYKAAYLFSVGLVVQTTKERLLREKNNMGHALNKQGWMTKYPEEKVNIFLFSIDKNANNFVCVFVIYEPTIYLYKKIECQRTRLQKASLFASMIYTDAISY